MVTHSGQDHKLWLKQKHSKNDLWLQHGTWIMNSHENMTKHQSFPRWPSSNITSISLIQQFWTEIAQPSSNLHTLCGWRDSADAQPETHPSLCRPRCLWTRVRCPSHPCWTGSQSPSMLPPCRGPRWCPYWQGTTTMRAFSSGSGKGKPNAACKRWMRMLGFHLPGCSLTVLDSTFVLSRPSLSSSSSSSLNSAAAFSMNLKTSSTALVSDTSAFLLSNTS